MKNFREKYHVSNIDIVMGTLVTAMFLSLVIFHCFVRPAQPKTPEVVYYEQEGTYYMYEVWDK